MKAPEGQKQSKGPGGNVFVFALLSLASFSMLLLSTRSFVVDFKDLGLSAVSGLRNGIFAGTSFITETVNSIQELSNLRKEYAELTDRIARYEQMERSAAEIREENRRLREQLEFSHAGSYDRIPAALIGRDPNNLFQAFVLNKGTVAGVQKDMAVIAYQNGVEGLVGKVIHAALFESLVMPLYDSSCHVGSRFQASRHEGIVEGQGSFDSPLLMRFISKRAREEINIGDVIISSGMERSLYPPDVTIGRVSRVLDYDYEISLSVEIEGTIDFSRLEYVFVVVPKIEAGASGLTIDG